MKLLFLLLFTLNSCTSWIKVPTIRSPYSLTTSNGFLISNIYTNPSDLEKEKDGIVIRYNLIVKNLQDSVRDIDLEKAVVTDKKSSFPMKCQSYQKEENYFKVMSQETFRIDCHAFIPNVASQKSDIKFLVTIPLEKDVANFSYIVRAEDFQ